MLSASILITTFSWLAFTVESALLGESILPRQSSSSSTYETPFPNVTWNNAAWQIKTTVLDQGHYQSRMTVANGYIGINVASLGPFFEADSSVDGDDINGWPLFQRRQTIATVGGFFDSQPTTNGSNFPWLYQYGGESVISGIPHWSSIILVVGNYTLNAGVDDSQISNYFSLLDMKDGVMNWGFTWTPGDGLGSFDVTYQLFAHKLYVNQAFVQMEIRASQNTSASVINFLDGDCAVRTTFAEQGTDDGLLYTAVNPSGIDNVTAYVYTALQGTDGFNASSAATVLGQDQLSGNQSTAAQTFNISLQAGQISTITKYIGIASTDGFTDPKNVAKNATTTAMNNGYQTSMQTHTNEWAQIFPADSVDDFSVNGSLPNDQNIVQLQITAITNPYHILQNTIGINALYAVGNAPINQHSISVGGLGSDSYAGQVFWDAEVWMQPGIVAAFPQAAQGIANYRKALFAQAQQNIKTAYQSSKANTTFAPEAAVFPWTSARFGNCTPTGPCFDYEYHINGDIAQELSNYWVVTGDSQTFKDLYFPIYDAIAQFYSNILQANGSQYSLTNMTDPDEYADYVDNGGYTMPLIADTLTTANQFRTLFGTQENATWTTQAQNVVISRDDNVNIILEYSGMNGSIDVKQADVVLDTYPLNYQVNYTSQDSLNDLDYYAAKQSSDGPSMTYSIFSIVANEVSPSGCSAYTYHLYSTQPYFRGPWFQFSEQLVDDYSTNGGTHPAYPFLTGHGGANQVVLFGYLGLRLTTDFALHVDPSLPPQIPQIRYRTFYWQGWPISAFSNATHTTITRLGTPYTAANVTYSNTSIPVLVGHESTNTTTYSLSPNSTITVQNRQPGLIPTVAGNLFQCVSGVTSPSNYTPGQFPLSAIDGASSTKWQPSSANDTASLTVALPSSQIGQKIEAVYFDWGTMPPVTFSIVLYNTTSSSTSNVSALEIASNQSVTISSPFNLTALSQITTPSTNTSWYTITSQDLYAAQYATLTIRGNQAYGTNDSARYNASADGASVAEWALLGPGNAVSGGSETDILRAKRDVEQGWLREVVGPKVRKNRVRGFERLDERQEQRVTSDYVRRMKSDREGERIRRWRG